MKNTLYAIVAATTLGMATPALAADYKVGNPMPNYKEGTILRGTIPWVFTAKGSKCMGMMTRYVSEKNQRELKFLVLFPSDSKLPYAIADGKSYIIDNKKADGSPGSDGRIDDVLKLVDGITQVTGHPGCNQK